jgi:MoxR-like ATPase
LHSKGVMEKIKNYLRSMYFEREDIIEGLIAALISRQHVLLVGPPGTAKSAIVVDLARCISGARYFQWLLTRFSTPEELFGPVSLKALENDVYSRNTSGKLPEAHIGFVDEIFKANSAILNSLLTLANERLFYNNGGAVEAPISSIIGASNEWAEENEGLEALFDRFILRYEVDSIDDSNNFVAMLQGNVSAEKPEVTLEELENLQLQAEMMTTVPMDILQALRAIRDALREEGIRPSDRRFRQSLSVLKAVATTNGRDTVTRKDMSILANSLWVSPERNEREIVRLVVDEFSLDPEEKKLAEFSDVFLGLQRIANEMNVSTADSNHIIELNNKLKHLVEQINQELPDNVDAKILIGRTKDLQRKIKEAALGV